MDWVGKLVYSVDRTSGRSIFAFPKPEISDDTSDYFWS